MNYFITELGFEGNIPKDHTNLRAAETWIKYLDAYHLNIFSVLNSTKVYAGTAWIIIPKGKEAVNFLVSNYFDTVKNLKTKFDKVYCIQEGETTFWNQYEVTIQIWIYSQFLDADKIYTQNDYDLKWLKGLFGNKKKYGLIIPVLDDSVLDKNKFKPKEDLTILAGPFIHDYNGLAQTIIAKQFNNEIHIPPMASSRMPKDSYETAEAVGVTYLSYMMWKEWMENLSRYTYGLFLVPSVGAATFPLNCAYHGIPCIGTNKAYTQTMLFPMLSIDYQDLEMATKLAIKLKTDQDFYKENSEYALNIIKTHFTKDNFIEILQQDL